MERSSEYRELMERIEATPKDQRKNLWDVREDMLKNAGFDWMVFKNDMTPMQKHFVQHIAAHVGHSAAMDVWRAFDTYLFKGGKDVHFKRKGSLSSIANQKAGTTMAFNKKTNIFSWNGGRDKNSISLKIRVKMPETKYEREMLEKEIANFRVIRRWSKRRYKYYLQFILKGDPVQKPRAKGSGKVGIDIGPQTIAVVSKQNALLLELADRIKRNHNEICALQRKLDRSKRSTNPDLFLPDGTVKRGVRSRWSYSNHYRRIAGRVRELQRKNAAIRKYQHTCLANRIISMGSEVFVEDMDFRALQHRAKKTTVNKNGRINSKKRFGKSLANKAPSEFLGILNYKLKQNFGKELKKVDKWNYRASQYDHTSQTYQKKGLSVRWFRLSNGDVVQRDLYAAFLLMNSNAEGTAPDQKACDRSYPMFKKFHDAELTRIKESGLHYPGSFGFAG